MSFTQSVVEEAALAWLEALGYTAAPGAEREEWRQVVLEGRLSQALARLNPGLPPDALAEAFKRLEGARRHREFSV